MDLAFCTDTIMLQEKKGQLFPQNWEHEIVQNEECLRHIDLSEATFSANQTRKGYEGISKWFEVYHSTMRKITEK